MLIVDIMILQGVPPLGGVK